MANQKEIRKRISSVKSTQKITRAMKMVAAARLNRAQSRITSLRPYAVSTAKTLHAVTGSLRGAAPQAASGEEIALTPAVHPLLAVRAEKRIAILVLTGDRGMCGAFNANVLRQAERLWKGAEAEADRAAMWPPV